MPKRKTTDHHEEIENIREDIDSLKSNVVALTKTVKHEVADTTATRLERIRKRGKETMGRVEKDVKAKPMQSLAMAFGAGLVLSTLMRRR